MWTRCADTPTALCAAWGDNCGNDLAGIMPWDCQLGECDPPAVRKKNLAGIFRPEKSTAAIHNGAVAGYGPQLSRSTCTSPGRTASIRWCVRLTMPLSGAWLRPSTSSRPTAGSRMWPTWRHGWPPSGRWSATSTRNSPGWYRATATCGAGSARQAGTNGPPT
jgi:hypothetical protein